MQSINTNSKNTRLVRLTSHLADFTDADIPNLPQNDNNIVIETEEGTVEIKINSEQKQNSKLGRANAWKPAQFQEYNKKLLDRSYTWKEKQFEKYLENPDKNYTLTWTGQDDVIEFNKLYVEDDVVDVIVQISKQPFLEELFLVVKSYYEAITFKTELRAGKKGGAYKALKGYVDHVQKMETITFSNESDKTCVIYALKTLTGFSKLFDKNIWDQIWTDIASYKDEKDLTVGSVIYDGLDLIDDTKMSPFVLVLIKAIYSTFKFNCQNMDRSDKLKDAIFTFAPESLKQKPQTLEAVKDKFFNKFNRHFFKCFQCNLLGNKSVIYGGSRKKVTYKSVNGKKYKVHTGQRGGKYILKDNKKCYL